MILLLSLFTTSAVILVVPDLSLIASLKAVRSLTEAIFVVVIVAEFEPSPIVNPTLPVACTFAISAFVTAVAVTPVNSAF